MSEMILEGYPGYRLELPDNENPQTTAWFAEHLRELALRRYELYRQNNQRSPVSSEDK